MLKTTSKQPRERKTVYLLIGLFALNVFGLIPVGVIGLTDYWRKRR